MRLVGRILKWIGLALLAVLAAGAIYQQVGALTDGGAMSGRMVAVNGHLVHIDCVGDGKRTLMLDAGLGAASFEWYRLQPALAANARVCTFDRPGQGASEAIDHAYDGVTAADELHALVAAAAIHTPFVYVGHSLGANFAQVYAGRYPRDLEAMILIEPGAPIDVLEDFHGSRAEALAMPATCGPGCLAGWAAGALGVSRFIVNHIYTGASGFSGNTRAMDLYHASAARTSMTGVAAAYFAALPKIAYQVVDARPPRALPVLVLASAIAPPGDPGEDMAAWRRRQLAYFASVAVASAHGEGPVTIPNSTHASMVMGDPSLHTAAAIMAFLASLPGR